MNDRNRRIDEFLKYFRDIAIQNPNYRLSKSNVYNELTDLGVPKKEKDARIDEHFTSWIEHFENDLNCNVFVSPKWRYFCQFISRDNLAKNADEHLKIYIPLDYAHIKRGAKEIFEFLSKENISHLSKIGSNIRFDDIVVRLINPEDVTKLLNFLKGNKYIQEGLMPSNPFTFNVDGIPMAVDGYLSFNSTVATLIKIYINDKIDNETLNTVNVYDFYEFVQRYYNQVFSNADGLKRLTSDFGEDESLTISELVNYKNVFELLLNARKIDFTLENYIEHYKKCANPIAQKAKYEEIKAIQNGQTPSSKSVDKKELIQSTNEILLQVIDGMVEKYGDLYAVLSNINYYIKHGDENYITSYKNLRDLVSKSTFRKDLINILKNNGCEFMDYAQSLLAERKHNTSVEKNDEKNSYSTIEKEVILLIKEILEVMTSKYSYRTAYNNLIEFINTGEPTMLTRTHGLRDKIVNSTFRIDLKNILNRRKTNIDNYLKIISKTIVAHSEIYLEKAILETYYKYEKKYQEGLSNVDGKNFVVGSIIQLIEKGKYFGFTRDNNARANLADNVSVSEVINIIKRTLNIEENQRISSHDIMGIAQRYIEEILANNPTPKL